MLLKVIFYLLKCSQFIFLQQLTHEVLTNNLFSDYYYYDYFFNSIPCVRNSEVCVCACVCVCVCVCA